MSQKFYLVITWIDLGYHANALFDNEPAAIQHCDGLNEAYRKQKISDLQRGCRYTEADALLWLANNKPLDYEVMTIELSK